MTKSYLENILDLLNNFANNLSNFIEKIELSHYVNDPYDGIVLIIPEYSYKADLNSEQKVVQIELLKEFNFIKEQIKFIANALSNSDKKNVEELIQKFENHINLQGSWDVRATPKSNAEQMKDFVNKLIEIISHFIVKDPTESLILDTNSLLINYKFEEYKKIVDKEPFNLILLPTVLGELDDLKIKSQNKDFSDKVKKVISIIKGLRTQGSLFHGIKIHKTINIKSIAIEPNLKETLSWLDADNKDDRIIASILELQRDNFSSKFILVTSDINLQNKAEYIGIPFKETPE